MESDNGNNQEVLPYCMGNELKSSKIFENQDLDPTSDPEVQNCEQEGVEPLQNGVEEHDDNAENTGELCTGAQDLTTIPALETSHAVSDQSESAIESSEAGEAIESATSHETVFNTHEDSDISNTEGTSQKTPKIYGLRDKSVSNNTDLNHVAAQSTGSEVVKDEDIVPNQEGTCSPFTPLNPAYKMCEVEKGGLLQSNSTSENLSLSQKKNFIRWLKKNEVLFCLVSGVVLLIGIVLIIVGVATMNSRCTNSQYMSDNGSHENDPISWSGHGSHGHDETLVDYKHIHSHESNTTRIEVVEENLAEGRQAYQSSSGQAYNASLAVDGNINKMGAGACSQTGIQVRPYWYVDLDSPKTVKRVKIYTPNDCCMGELHNFEVRVGDNTDDLERNTLCKHHMGTALKMAINIVCDWPTTGQFVSIQLLGDADRPRDRLTLCEVMVFG